MKHFLSTVVLIGLFCVAAPGQVTFQRLVQAQREPQNWLTYNGNLGSTHHSSLDQINAANVANLDLKWVSQAQSLEKFEATPLVVDGVMYVTEPPNTVVAIDTRTGRPFWRYEHPMPETTYVCCGNINRGVAILQHNLPWHAGRATGSAGCFDRPQEVGDQSRRLYARLRRDRSAVGGQR